MVADIASAKGGSPCPDCGRAMRAERGVEVGNIFKLGTRYAEALGANFLDSDGERKPVVMGSYGIGVGRLLACIAEEHHDEDGLVWPVSIAPYHVHLVAAEVEEKSDGLYEALRSLGVEVLYDDRRESLGAKFKDADLIGIPLRLTLTPVPCKGEESRSKPAAMQSAGSSPSMTQPGSSGTGSPTCNVSPKVG